MKNIRLGVEKTRVAQVQSLSECKSQSVLISESNLAEVAAHLPFHARFALRQLTRLQCGALCVKLPDGSSWRFVAPAPGPDAALELHNWRITRRALLGGSLGVAESYLDGDWSSPDVTTFLLLFLANEQLYLSLATPNWFFNLLQKFNHWFNENTQKGSRKNISAHYDLGNSFYERWLDPTMTYSSALYDDNATNLTEAQNAKYRSLARNVGIGENDSVLEIGCGWGGFAEFAAKETGCHVTGLTISREQFDFARQRMFRLGLNEKVEIRLQDYRDEGGKYDAIASIEMFEAVGERYWPTYFAKLHDCLKEQGRAGLQLITIADSSYDYYRAHPDFIQRYIFPGGMLPSPSIVSGLGDGAQLKLVKQKIFPKDYARTLAEWRDRFLAVWDDLRPLGFDERFKRMWEYYFHYCEAGFLSGNIDVRQVFYQRT